MTVDWTTMMSAPASTALTVDSPAQEDSVKPPISIPSVMIIPSKPNSFRNNSDVIELWDSDIFKEEIKQHLIEKDNSQFEEPEPQQKSDFNYYEILGASRNDTQEEIKRKYKELALKFHPDKAKSALSEDMMKQITEAKDVLCDVDKRRKYDSELDSI